MLLVGVVWCAWFVLFCVVVLRFVVFGCGWPRLVLLFVLGVVGYCLVLVGRVWFWLVLFGGVLIGCVCCVLLCVVTLMCFVVARCVPLCCVCSVCLCCCDG